jgi:hypothetical protein
MDLQQVVISPAEAEAKLAEYTKRIGIERTAEDAAIAQAYRAAARGLGVIELPATIAAGGFFATGLPKIAVCRVGARTGFVRWDGQDLVFADTEGWGVNRGALINRHSVRVQIPGDDLPPRRENPWRQARTLAPIVPPNQRPKRYRLTGCHVLWEVEKWERIAPRDPALIKHIRGRLWAVLAVWDLTDLERLVLGQ